MQELIVGIILVVVLFFVVKRIDKYRKKFIKTDDACNGCGSSCEGCPIAPGITNQKKL